MGIGGFPSMGKTCETLHRAVVIVHGMEMVLSASSRTRASMGSSDTPTSVTLKTWMPFRRMTADCVSVSPNPSSGFIFSSSPQAEEDHKGDSEQKKEQTCVSWLDLSFRLSFTIPEGVDSGDDGNQVSFDTLFQGGVGRY